MVAAQAEKDFAVAIAEKRKEIPPHKWQRDRSENILRESTRECIDHLGNVDDAHLATASLGGLLGVHDDPVSQAVYVTRLARVRRLLYEARTAPDTTLPLLRNTLADCIQNSPEIMAKFQDLMNGKPSEAGVREAYHKAREQALAATFILAEVNDSQSLPLLMKQCELAHPLVPRANILYSMHLLVLNYPSDKLTAAARSAQQDYIHTWRNRLPPPTVEQVSQSWKSDYDESDPRIVIQDRQGLVLTDCPAMIVDVFPSNFSDQTDLFHESRPSEQSRALLSDIRNFVTFVSR